MDLSYLIFIRLKCIVPEAGFKCEYKVDPEFLELEMCS